MAKLKAPLMSLGASGALGKALVFFPWKGLDAVREYVVPANPKSDAQNTQRGHLRAAVTEIHTAEVSTDSPVTSADKSAYSLDGSLKPTPRTWFNQIVKILVDCMVDAQNYGAITGGDTTYLTASTARADAWNIKQATQNGAVKYGTSKSALLNSVTANFVAHAIAATMTGLVVGTKYYWQWQATPVTDKAVLRSGIYTYLHEA